MRYGQDSGYGGGYDPVSRLRGATVVKTLIIINVAVYAVQFLSRFTGHYNLIIGLFGMVPSFITDHWFVWQFVTAMFLHGDFFHILFNMLGLFFFGPELEYGWGSRRFLGVYMVIGIVANLFAYLLNIHAQIPTIGASGALFGLLGAYAALYPNRQIIFMIFPIKAKYLIIFYFIFSLMGTTGIEGYSGTAYAVHLAGIVLGVAYIKLRWDRLRFFAGKRWSRLRLWYLKRKYRHLKIADEILLDDEPDNFRYKN